MRGWMTTQANSLKKRYLQKRKDKKRSDKSMKEKDESAKETFKKIKDEIEVMRKSYNHWFMVLD
jgi:hypothetical protein